ncbi:MAG TPA: DNA-binding domain-containing protein [Luteibacter sp.]|nr:DNA-binding domain-containing protein [Luteibacter sp.]
MNLAEWQREFRTWLVTPSDEAATRFGAGATAGLAVYQNNYRAQLMSCLEVSYPQVRRWIGDDAFREASINHIERHSPQTWTLDHYGRDFPSTLLSMYPRNPDLQELAWIEWALSEAFVAGDAASMPADALSHVDWDAARLVFTPSLRMHAARTNAGDIWSALEADTDVPEGSMLDAPGGYVVWRRGFTSRLKRVDAVEYAALCSLRDDDRFAVLCDTLVEHLDEEDGVARAGTLLADWLGAAIVVAVDG